MQAYIPAVPTKEASKEISKAFLSFSALSTSDPEDGDKFTVIALLTSMKIKAQRPD